LAQAAPSAISASTAAVTPMPVRRALVTRFE
jgi:hypothetical protein